MESSSRMPGPTPHLSVADVAQATTFYVEALNATLLEKLIEPGSGRTIFCALRFDHGLLYLSENRQALPAPGLMLHLSVIDAIETYSRALSAGAEALQPPEEAAWGKRPGRFRDPAGIVWSVSQPVIAPVARVSSLI